MKKTMTGRHFRSLMQSVQDLDSGIKTGKNLADLMEMCIDVAFYGVLGVGETLSPEQRQEWDKACSVMVVLRLKKAMLAMTGEADNDGCDS